MLGKDVTGADVSANDVKVKVDGKAVKFKDGKAAILAADESDAPDEPEIPTVAEEPEIPFTDVKKGDPYYNAIVYVYQSGIMNGVADTQFDSTGTLTRAMFVTILGRLAQIDPTDYTGVPFSDVEPIGTWNYVPYVAWAAENSIVLGYGNGTFGPGNPVTNEQAVLMLQRFAKYLDLEIVFADMAVEGASAWAADAVAWAYENEIYPTETAAVFTSPAQRAWIAKAIYNFVGFLIK